MAKASKYPRYEYNEMAMRDLSPRMQKEVHKLVAGAAKAEKVDEHGTWTFGFENLGKKEYEYVATKWGLYDVGTDLFSRRRLIVIQIRQTVGSPYGPSTRKSYFLIGRNEDNTIFAHPVSGHTVHAAIKRNADVIQAVQKWIFGIDYSRVLRQGDVAIIPLRKLPKTDKATYREMEIEDSHVIKADQFYESDGHLYAINLHAHHIPQTHPDITHTGIAKIVVGRRGRYHDFANPTID